MLGAPAMLLGAPSNTQNEVGHAKLGWLANILTFNTYQY